MVSLIVPTEVLRATEVSYDSVWRLELLGRAAERIHDLGMEDEGKLLMIYEAIVERCQE